jgi:hypothetical protein
MNLIQQIVDILQRAIDSGNWIMVNEAIAMLLEFDEYQMSDDSFE